MSIPDVRELISSVRADPGIEIYPLSWGVFERSLIISAIQELHDRFIVATALHLQDLGHTVSLPTKDATIAQSGLVPTI